MKFKSDAVKLYQKTKSFMQDKNNKLEYFLIDTSCDLEVRYLIRNLKTSQFCTVRLYYHKKQALNNHVFMTAAKGLL